LWSAKADGLLSKGERWDVVMGMDVILDRLEGKAALDMAVR
jgi:hypothetical protein